MKIKCNRAALYEAVQLASSIVPARTPKPILQCTKIQADQQQAQEKIVILLAPVPELVAKSVCRSKV